MTAEQMSGGASAPRLARQEKAAQTRRSSTRVDGRRPRRFSWTPYLFVLPYAFLLVAVGIGPAVYAIYSSLTTFDADGVASWAGLANWVSVFKDYRLLSSAQNVGAYLVIWLPLLLAVVVSLALALSARRGRFTATMRFVYYLPGAVTGSAAALLWLYMLSPGLSPFSGVLDFLGIDSVTSAVSSDRFPFVLAIMATAIHAGNWIVILYGALEAIPAEYVEAAKIDGASSTQVIRYIKLPVIKRYVILALVSSFAAGTQVFVEPAVLATGAPGQISPTWSTNQLAYYFATQFGQFGMAAALSVALFMLGLIVAIVVLTRTNFYSFEEHS